MNWLEIFGIFILITIGIWRLVGITYDDFLDSYKWYKKTWINFCLVAIALSTTVTTIAIPFVFSNLKAYPKWTSVDASLVSLQNTPSIEGNIQGSSSMFGGSIQGSINTSSSCNFVVKWPENVVKVYNVDVKKVTFVLSTSDTYKATKKMHTYVYQYAIWDKQEYYDDADCEWIIEIPENKIKNYIKFN